MEGPSLSFQLPLPSYHACASYTVVHGAALSDGAGWEERLYVECGKRTFFQASGSRIETLQALRLAPLFLSHKTAHS